MRRGVHRRGEGPLQSQRVAALGDGRQPGPQRTQLGQDLDAGQRADLRPTNRRHSTLGYLTPREYELSYENFQPTGSLNRCPEKARTLQLMIVLGVNSVYHESSAAVVRDGVVLAAAEEERFNRRKHAKPSLVDNADDLPGDAIRFCIRQAGITSADIDAVAYSFDPLLRRQLFRTGRLSLPGSWGSEDGENAFLAALDRIPDQLSAALGVDLTGRIRWVPHHVAHAASAYYPPGFDSADVLVVDGIGEPASTVLFAGAGCRLTRLEELRYPDSIGFVWEKLSVFLGFSEYEACKVMGLAGYGDPATFAAAYAKFLSVDGLLFHADPDILRFRLPDVQPLEALLGPARRGGPIESPHADIAAALQDATNRAMLGLAAHLYDLHPSGNLCLAGGVALNCTANSWIKDRSHFVNTYIPPAPHDAGTAVGRRAANVPVHPNRRCRPRRLPRGAPR